MKNARAALASRKTAPIPHPPKSRRARWRAGRSLYVRSLSLAFAMFAAAAPGRAAAAAADDERAVATLDTDYQAAVKNNDAATMDRILADDFALVTGRGQAFGKTDLLAEARKQSTNYERQEEESGSQKV